MFTIKVLQSLHGHLSGLHFVILLQKFSTVSESSRKNLEHPEHLSHPTLVLLFELLTSKCWLGKCS